MKYTDRFMTVPISIFDNEAMRLTGKEDLTDSFTKILPGQIESYRPSYAAGGDISNMDSTFVRFKSGDEFLVRMPLEEFEQALCFHMDE